MQVPLKSKWLGLQTDLWGETEREVTWSGSSPCWNIRTSILCEASGRTHPRYVCAFKSFPRSNNTSISILGCVRNRNQNLCSGCFGLHSFMELPSGVVIKASRMLSACCQQQLTHQCILSYFISIAFVLCKRPITIKIHVDGVFQCFVSLNFIEWTVDYNTYVWGMTS